MNYTKPRKKNPSSGTKIVSGGNTVRAGLSKSPKCKGNGTGN